MLPTETLTESPAAVGSGMVAIAVPRSMSTANIAVGDLVHAIVVTDPLIAGETRPPAVAFRDLRVVHRTETSTTVAVAESDAPALVNASIQGTVTLARSG